MAGLPELLAHRTCHVEVVKMVTPEPASNHPAEVAVESPERHD